MEREENGDSVEQLKRWSPPPNGWLKCNIGVDWMKVARRGGGAWVLRDEEGKVILHSRRAFSQIRSLREVNLEALVWCIECIAAHRCNRVIFAIDDRDLTQMILRPKSWPNFKRENVLIRSMLGRIEWWKLVQEKRANNRGALLIAKSVTKGGQQQSYVAAGPPRWLLNCFENEEVQSSV